MPMSPAESTSNGKPATLTNTMMVLMDVEGTTTKPAFVYETLFPYARTRLRGYLDRHKDHPAVQELLSNIQTLIQAEEGRDVPLSEMAAVLEEWMDDDRKETNLKALQGRIWKAGYENSDFHGHVYDDVLPSWQRWKDSGLMLGIFSSGSIQAQKLLYQYSSKGDIRPYLSHYFDTQVGAKRDPKSYRNIAEAVSLLPHNIAFISDVIDELDAAHGVGYQVVHVVRPEYKGPTDSPYITIESFEDLTIRPFNALDVPPSLMAKH